MKRITYDKTILILQAIIITIALLWITLIAIPIAQGIHENCAVYQSAPTMDAHVCTSGTYYTQR